MPVSSSLTYIDTSPHSTKTQKVFIQLIWPQGSVSLSWLRITEIQLSLCRTGQKPGACVSAERLAALSVLLYSQSLFTGHQITTIPARSRYRLSDLLWSDSCPDQFCLKRYPVGTDDLSTRCLSPVTSAVSWGSYWNLLDLYKLLSGTFYELWWLLVKALLGGQLDHCGLLSVSESLKLSEHEKMTWKVPWLTGCFCVN